MRPYVFLVVALALCLPLVAVACGGGEDRTTEPTTVEGEQPAPPEEEELPEGDAAAGAEIFQAQGCGGCHTLADAGATGTTGVNLDQSQPTYERTFVQVRDGGGGMPAYEGQLSEQEIANVSAYVAEASGGG